MSLDAYHPSDAMRKLIHIDQWLISFGATSDGKCRVCHQSIKVKGDKSQRQTHFAHLPNSSCPTVASSHIPYAVLRALPRDPSIENGAKQYTFLHIEAIYQKMRKIVPALSWKEMHELLATAKAEKIWSLKGMPHECIPYVLLTCTTSFKANVQHGRKDELFFVLEPSPDQGDYWNFPKNCKRFIWEIKLPNRTVTHYEIDLATPVRWYMNRVQDLLV